MEWGPSVRVEGTPEDRCMDRSADYLLPLATRCRSLFTMDFAQAVYMSELRSTPAGHWSYRNVAWQMYQQLARYYPALAAGIRISDPSIPVDLLKR